MAFEMSNSKDGYPYYFQVHSLFIIPGFSTIMINRYCHTLSIAPVERDGHIFFPVEDFKTIYAHVYEVECTETMATVKRFVRQAYVPLVDIGGVAMFDLDLVLTVGFEYKRLDKITMEKNHLVLFTCLPEVKEIPKDELKYMDHMKRGKGEGELYELFWFEEGGKQVPYHLFLPSYYDANKKYPIIFYLHGGIGTPHSGYEHSINQLQYYAEKFGFMVCGVDGFIRNATYGYHLPPNPGDPDLDPSCPENPNHLTKEQLYGHKLGERCLEETIKVICKRYSADPDRMFLMGNSMGGEGSLWFALTHPGMFRAISPAGAMVNWKYVDPAPLKGLPILFVCGTEDMHGFDYLRDGVKAMEEAGLDIEHIYVGGGTHTYSWVYALAETFEFFKKYL